MRGGEWMKPWTWFKKNDATLDMAAPNASVVPASAPVAAEATSINMSMRPSTPPLEKVVVHGNISGVGAKPPHLYPNKQANVEMGVVSGGRRRRGSRKARRSVRCSIYRKTSCSARRRRSSRSRKARKSRKVSRH